MVSLEEMRHRQAAKKTYRKGYERFQNFHHTLALADILNGQGRVKESVQTYYEASAIALLKDRKEGLNLCTQRIQKIDPDMKELDTSQKMHLLAQTHIFRLSRELEKTKNKLQGTQTELQETQDELDVSKSTMQLLIDKELQPMKNELQSMKDEIQSMKNERQSSNYELKPTELPKQLQDQLPWRKRENEEVKDSSISSTMEEKEWKKDPWTEQFL